LYPFRNTAGAVSLLVALLAGVPIAAQTSGSTAASTSSADGRLRGSVVDSSAGVLPGVVVTAVSAEGRQLGTTVTGASGEFTFEGLPAGAVLLNFHLDGFVDAKAKATVRPPGAPVDEPIAQRLELAAMAESVTVRAEPPPPPPPPPPVLLPVPPHDETSLCAPAKAEVVAPSIGTIRGGVYDAAKQLFAAGDEITIDGGTINGLAVGQNLVVRRRYPTRATSAPNVRIVGEHSAGLLQIVSATERSSSAVVVYTCDAMMTGDYLAAFEPQPARSPEPVGRPAFELAARILFAGAGEMVGVVRRMLVIDQGAAQGMRPGQRLTIFRKSPHGHPTILGQAVVVTVRSDSATIRIEQARDAVFFGPDGDWAAPQWPPQVGQR
jgi:hypothetical protein